MKRIAAFCATATAVASLICTGGYANDETATTAIEIPPGYPTGG